MPSSLIYRMRQGLHQNRRFERLHCVATPPPHVQFAAAVRAMHKGCAYLHSISTARQRGAACSAAQSAKRLQQLALCPQPLVRCSQSNGSKQQLDVVGSKCNTLVLHLHHVALEFILT